MSDDTQREKALDEALATLSGPQPWAVAVVCGEVMRLRESLSACQRANRELLASTEQQHLRLSALEEREPLVRNLLDEVEADDEADCDWDYVVKTATAVRDFDLGAEAKPVDACITISAGDRDSGLLDDLIRLLRNPTTSPADVSSYLDRLEELRSLR